MNNPVRVLKKLFGLAPRSRGRPRPCAFRVKLQIFLYFYIMSDNFKIKNKEKSYYLTLTTVGWVDIFTRVNHKLLIANSLQYCIKNKGLVIFAYCIMPSHVHLICRAEGIQNLSEILRDFKGYTSKKIIKQVQEEPESRREWLLEYFSKACSHLKRKQKHKVWQDSNHAKEIISTSFLYEKLEYIHNNPVQD